MPSSRSLLIVLLLGFLTWPAFPQNGGPVPDELRTIAEQHRQQLAQLAEDIRQSPEDSHLWSRWFTQRTILQNFDSTLQGEDRQTMDPAVLEQQKKAYLEAWFERWQVEYPDSGALALLRLSMLAGSDEILPGLIDLSNRFPEHSEIAGRLMRMHVSRGSLTEATAVAEAFLARNPKNPDGYRLVREMYSRAGRHQDIIELADAWILAHPHDPDPYFLWWRYHKESLDPESRDRRARQISAQLRGHDKAMWCGQIGRDLAEAVIECYTNALAQIDETAPSFVQTLTAYTNFLKDAGHPAAFESAFAQLPADRQEFIRGRIAIDLISNRRCDEALGIVRASAEPGGVLAAASRHLPYCFDNAAFRQATLETLRRSTPEQASRILAQIDPSWPIEEVEAILHEWTEVSSRDRFKTLAVVYQAAGAVEKQIALFEKWLQEDPAPSSQHVQDLAELYLQKGEPAKAIAATERFIQNHPNRASFPLIEHLVALHTAQGQPDRAAEWSERLFAETGERRGLGALLLARLAFARGALEEAMDFYNIFFEETPVDDWHRASGYPNLLLGLGDVASIERHYERQWQALNEKRQGSGLSREEWVGDQLKELSFQARAMDLYERAIEAEGGSDMLLVKAAGLAEELEAWDRALALRQEILKRAPNDPESWRQLAKHHLDRGQIATAFDVMDKAFDRLAEPDLELWNLWADAILGIDAQNSTLSETVLRNAIEILQQAIEVFDERVYSRTLLKHRLTQLYRHLELETPVS